MELRHLRYFVAVAEELHFGRAAKRLNLTQPPLSQQIHQLEEELGVALFRRHARGVALTDAGRTFLERARNLLIAADDAVRDAQFADRGEIGQLRVAYASNALFELVPAIVRRYREGFPAVRLLFQDLSTGDQIEAFRDGTLDIGFVNLPVPAEEFTTRIVGHDRLVAAVRRDHPLADRGVVGAADLASVPWLRFPRIAAPALFDRIVGAFERAGHVPEVAHEARASLALLSFAAAGMGFALVSRYFARAMASELAVLEVDEPAFELEMAVAWPTDRASAVLGGFVSVVDEFIAEQRRSTMVRGAVASR